MAFDGVTWNEAAPDNSDLASQIDDYMKDVKIAVRSRLALEHIFSATSAATGDAGIHRYISMQPQAAAPTLSAGLTQVGALYLATSAAGYALTFENSAGSSLVIVNSAFHLPIVTSGTQGGVVICSSANPDAAIVLAGSTDNYVLATHSNTGAPDWKSPTALISGLFGSWTDKSASYGAQLAATDGIVVASISCINGVPQIQGYTDGNANPTTLRAHGGVWAGGGSTIADSICFPVRKGDYWKVVVTTGGYAETVTVMWLAVGA